MISLTLALFICYFSWVWDSTGYVLYVCYYTRPQHYRYLGLQTRSVIPSVMSFAGPVLPGQWHYRNSCPDRVTQRPPGDSMRRLPAQRDRSIIVPPLTTCV